MASTVMCTGKLCMRTWKGKLHSLPTGTDRRHQWYSLFLQVCCKIAVLLLVLHCCSLRDDGPMHLSALHWQVVHTLVPASILLVQLVLLWSLPAMWAYPSATSVLSSLEEPWLPVWLSSYMAVPLSAGQQQPGVGRPDERFECRAQPYD